LTKPADVTGAADIVAVCCGAAGTTATGTIGIAVVCPALGTTCVTEASGRGGSIRASQTGAVGGATAMEDIDISPRDSNPSTRGGV